MNKISNSQIFRTEEDFQEIYSACLEEQPQAPQPLQDANRALSEAFWAYLAEYEEFVFRYAYQCGYEAGSLRGGAVVHRTVVRCLCAGIYAR